MAFNSIVFIAFFFITVAIYFLAPSKARKYVLLLASLLFYAYYDPALVLFLLVITGVNFMFTRPKVVSFFINKKKKTLWLLIGLAINLGPLFLYKYWNFTGKIGQFILRRLGIGIIIPRISWVVPLGLSFITFSLIAYLVDVYRGKIKPAESFLRFALWVSFFPKVVQGPIVKYQDFEGQIDRDISFSMREFRAGALMALFGLFMKMTIADRASLVVDTIFASLNTQPGSAIVLGTVLFAVQLYFDFAGYSLTAIGCSRVLGYEIKPNFTRPYFSLSVGEFWRRWHMSLNDWLKEYVYIPLGGSRCSKPRYFLNILITFAVSGLWHGANFGYIIWGLLNGLYVGCEGLVSKNRRKKEEGAGGARLQGLWNVFRRIKTLLLIGFSWLFFRAAGLGSSIVAVKQIVTDFDLTGLMNSLSEEIASANQLFGINLIQYWFLLGTFLVGFGVDLLANRKDLVTAVTDSSKWIRWPIYYLLLFAIIILGVYGFSFNAGAFLYTQF